MIFSSNRFEPDKMFLSFQPWYCWNRKIWTQKVIGNMDLPLPKLPPIVFAILATRSLFGILTVICHYYLSFLFVSVISNREELRAKKTYVTH